jgi:crotonobetainyl-CoA:carnitine CoA-transferase CaiB-like acyl-CoA transferase
MWAAIGILAALARVRRGDGGSYVDVALADSVAAWSVWEIADYVATGQAPGPLGTAHRLAAPYQAFGCADGRTLVIGAVDRTWNALEQALEIDLDDDPRFAGEYERFLHRRELADILADRFATAARDEWVARLRAVGVPCGPVNSIADIVADEHFAYRGLFLHDKARFRHPTIVNTPIVADGAPRARGPAPLTGEQTEPLLKSLGYDQDVIDKLVDRGVIGTPGGNRPDGPLHGGNQRTPRVGNEGD